MVLVVIAIVAISLYSFFKGSYNSMVTMQEGVSAAWSNVENQYQRRSDLIPNLVNTVKGYAAHESQTLEAVIEARANATKVTLNVDNMDEQSLQKFNAAQGEVSSALSKLLAVSESYPDLKANQNFLELQAQLEGTENRISTERKRFNEIVQAYNSYVRNFPRNIIASMFGFDVKPYFAAEAGAENAPKVEF
ncbi:MAG: LemA family protein [Rikenellaceae bacterium]